MGDTTTNQAHAGTTNTKDDNVVDEDYIWIFCFGSNSLKQLSDRVQTPYPDLITRTFPAIAKGWLRGFKAITKSWENKSTATIWFTGNVVDDFVTGIVVKMTKLEVSKLDPYEGYPYKYIRINLKLHVYNKNGYKMDVNMLLTLSKPKLFLPPIFLSDSPCACTAVSVQNTQDSQKACRQPCLPPIVYFKFVCHNDVFRRVA